MKSINARKRKTRKKNRSEQNIKRNETFSNAFLLGFRAHETFLQNCKNYTTKTTTAKKTVAAVAGAAAATDKRREYNTIAILYSFLVGFVFFFVFTISLFASIRRQHHTLLPASAPIWVHQNISLFPLRLFVHPLMAQQVAVVASLCCFMLVVFRVLILL